MKSEVTRYIGNCEHLEQREKELMIGLFIYDFIPLLNLKNHSDSTDFVKKL